MRRPTVCAAAAAAALLLAASGCGGGSGSAEPPATTRATAAPAGQLARGEAVFLGISGCGGCHTLAAAGRSGTVASSLDERKPTAARVREVLEKGAGAMPSYAKQLSAQEIADVAAYVAWAAARGAGSAS
jgi:mono/diheme cytochrome c family protein